MTVIFHCCQDRLRICLKIDLLFHVGFRIESDPAKTADPSFIKITLIPKVIVIRTRAETRFLFYSPIEKLISIAIP